MLETDRAELDFLHLEGLGVRDRPSRTRLFTLGGRVRC